MKAVGLLLVAFALFGCVVVSTPYEVARREAARLRERHQSWLSQQHGNVEWMKLTSLGLSSEATRIGLFAAMVDSEVVVIATREFEGVAEGYVFGKVSSAKLQSLEKLGFVLTPIGIGDVFQFRVAITETEANKAPEPTPRPVTIPAEPGIAPGRVVAHL